MSFKNRYIPNPLIPTEDEAKQIYLSQELEKISQWSSNVSEYFGNEGGEPPTDPTDPLPPAGHTHDHRNLVGVFPDQHHPQIHAHNTHTDIGPDDHHSELHTIESHSDVTLTPPTDGNVLVYDEDTSQWINEPKFQFSEAFPTGLSDGGELNIGPGVNDIEVIAGVGVLINSFDEPTAPPATQVIQWAKLNEAITVVPSVAGSLVWFSVADTGVPSASQPFPGYILNDAILKQYATPPGPSLAKQEIFLGVAIHNGDTWNEVSNPKVINSAAETLREVATTVLPLSSIIAGGSTQETGTFQIEQDEGVVWEQNRNWHNDKSDPNRETLPAQSPVTFKYVTQDFTVNGAATSTFDPDTYDQGGSPVNVPGGSNTCTIQKVYVDPANNYWCLYGQYTYNNFFTAEANLATDLAKSVIPFILQNSILLGYAVMEKGKNNWDPNEAVWIPNSGGLAGGGGGTPITSHSNLSDLDVVNAHPTFTGAGSTFFVPDPVTEQGFYLRDDGVFADGVQGPQGEKGDQGEPGLDGAKGDQGEIGPEGPTAVSTDAGNTSVLGTDNLIYTPASGGSGGATESEITQAGHGFSVLDCVRFNGVAWVKAQADDASTTALGVVVAVADTDNFTFAMSGRYQLGALTADEWYYLSDTVAGDLTPTEPAISQPIIYSEDGSWVVIYPYRPSLKASETGPLVGEIKAYYGLEADLQFGWYICDGLNGTPDFRGRALMGADGNGIVLGSDDGSMPAAGVTGADGGHGHSAGSGSTTPASVFSSTAGAHSHGSSTGTTQGPNQSAAGSGGGGAGNHSHTISSQDAHAHTVPGSSHSHTVSVGDASDHTHTTPAGDLPPVHGVHFIMYTGV